MNNEQMLYIQLDALAQRAKDARVCALTLANPASLAGDTLAQDLAELSKDFMGVSTALRQSAREAADEEAAQRPKWQPPKMNARRAVDAIVKRGGHRVTA
jgi:hypothetical protein